MPVPEPAIAPIERVDAILREWLADPDLTLICGRWSDGGIMELMPEGRATLSQPRYDGDFAGLRDLDLTGQQHHIHLDLGKLPRAVYLVSPSVCYGFRPSFEVRLCAADDIAASAFGLGLGVRHPYSGNKLSGGAVRRYLRRLANHRLSDPDVVGVRAIDGPLPSEAARRRTDDWAAIGQCVAEEFGVDAYIHDAESFTAAMNEITGSPA